MATATAPKVRLVRCPKCLLVLPEVADFPVYKCGGCDTVLVAKSKKAIAKSTLVWQETEVVVASKSVYLSEHGESSSSGLQEVLPSPSESWSGNQHISTGSRSEEHGENLSVEGQHTGRYEKDRNTSRYSNSDDESDRDMLDKSISNEGQQNATGLLQTESLDSYEKDQNTSGDGDGDGESDCGMLDENQFNEGPQNEAGMLRMESLDRYERDQKTTRDSDGDDESDHGIFDEDGTHKGKQNGNGLLSMEAFEHCNVHQPGVYTEGSLSTELHSGNEELMLEIFTGSHSKEHSENLSVESQDNGCYEKDQNASRDSDGESDCGMLDENRSKERPLNGTGLLQTESLEHCNDQQIGVPIEGCLSTELHHNNEKSMLAAETNLEAEANDKTLQFRIWD